MLLPFIGGFRFRLCDQGVSVLLGLFRVPLKLIPWSALDLVEVIPDFDPATAFLGVGWRVDRASSTTGYVLSRGPAVRLFSGGWKYVLGVADASGFADQCRRMATSPS